MRCALSARALRPPTVVTRHRWGSILCPCTQPTPPASHARTPPPRCNRDPPSGTFSERFRSTENGTPGGLAQQRRGLPGCGFGGSILQARAQLFLLWSSGFPPAIDSSSLYLEVSLTSLRSSRHPAAAGGGSLARPAQPLATALAPREGQAARIGACREACARGAAAAATTRASRRGKS